MSGRLDGKIALITGGSAGMAFAAAELFVQEGAERIYITGRNQEGLDEAVSRLGSRAVGIRADGASLEDTEKLFATIKADAGRLDVFYASAGGGRPLELLQDVTPEGFDETFNLNVRGTVFAVQKAAELMANGGSIILNGSAGVEKALPGMSIYTASKATLRSFAKSWAAELAGRGIRVNVVHPGPTATRIMDHMPKDQVDFLASLTTFKRLGQPAEVAGAVLFLASDQASFVTGTELFASGGMGQN